MNRLLWLLRLIRDLCATPLVMLIPRNKSKIIFGAWMGKQYACNPKYLFEYFISKGEKCCYWIGDESLRESVLSVNGAHFIRKGTLAAWWHCLTAGFYVYNVDWTQDIIDFPNCGRVKMFYTTHGYPDKKVLDRLDGNGALAKKESKPSSKFRKLFHRILVNINLFLYSEESWFSASSPFGDELRVKGEPMRLSYDCALKAGLPRADYVICKSKDPRFLKVLRARYAKILGVAADKKWFLYVPTWRRDKSLLYSFTTSSKKTELSNLLKKSNAVIIEKHHPSSIWNGDISAVSTDEVKVIDENVMPLVDTQELQLVADVLITDYSSVYYDTVLMNKPVIHYVYDYDRFMNLDIGFAFNLLDFGGGPFVYTEDELLNTMKLSSEELLSRRSARTLAEHLSYEKGCSCETYYGKYQELMQSGKTLQWL